MRLALSCALAVSFATVVACSFTSDFSGVSDGPGAPIDAGFDAAIDDAGSDAGSDGGFSCDNHQLCTTFDNGALTADGWKVQQLGMGQASLDTTQFLTPPASFHSVVPANGSTDHWSAIIFQTTMVAPTYTTLTYAFDFRLAICSATGGGMTIVALNPNATTVFGLVITKTGLEFGEVKVVDGGQTFTPAPLDKQPPFNAWTRLSLVVTNPSNPSVDVLYDQTTVLKSHPVAAFTPTSAVLLNLGNNGSGPNTKCDIGFDNVTFDTQ